MSIRTPRVELLRRQIMTGKIAVSLATLESHDHIIGDIQRGVEISATATIKRILGNTIEFIVTASDDMREIGRDRHTRAIVDEARFMTKASERR